MERYFIELSYHGKSYNGWQRQANAPSVQQTIEDGLTKLLRTRTEITGCGRTDTGVHASFYIAHFDSDVSFVPDAEFLYHLNCILPHDIAISAIYPTDKHARFDARQREYHYYIERAKNPFKTETAWFLNTTLNVDAMHTATARLLMNNDFTSFAKLHSDAKTNICSIFHASWEMTDNQLVFTIRADRFLRGMVRGIVGTLIDVGREKISAADFAQIIQAKDRKLASAQAPAHGLFLTNVIY